MTEILLHPVTVSIAAASMAVLFANAALFKLSDRDLLIYHLTGYDIPEHLRHGVAYITIILESFTAVTLLSPWREIGAFLAMNLLGIYALAMCLQLIKNRMIDCGCGGQALPVSWMLVVRNVLLIVVAGIASQTTAPQNLTWFDLGVIIAAVLLMVLLYSAINQVLKQQAILSQRLFKGSL